MRLVVSGASLPTASPPGHPPFPPPPRRIEICAAVRHCAADASIPVLSARLVFVNAAVCTPLTVCTVPACARHDPGGGGGGGGGGAGGGGGGGDVTRAF